jgi:hypothetical protein
METSGMVVLSIQKAVEPIIFSNWSKTLGQRPRIAA